jgi:hypothetical protein
MDKFKVSSGHERLLCYAAAILTAHLSREGQTYTAVALIPGSIIAAKELIKQVYETEL